MKPAPCLPWKRCVLRALIHKDLLTRLCLCQGCRIFSEVRLFLSCFNTFFSNFIDDILVLMLFPLRFTVHTSKVTFHNSFRDCNVNSTIYQLPFLLLQILNLCLYLRKSNIVLGIGSRCVTGLALRKWFLF